MVKSKMPIVNKGVYEVDHGILTPQEHLLFGSNLEDEYLLYPRKPLALTDGRLTYEQVKNARETKKVIVSPNAWDLYNVGLTDENRRYAMVFKLQPVDPETGQVEEELPVLVGVYDPEAGLVSYYDPDELKKFQLTDEGKRRLSFEHQRLSVERVGI